jgi:DNA oxidative demethylase
MSLSPHFTELPGVAGSMAELSTDVRGQGFGKSNFRSGFDAWKPQDGRLNAETTIKWFHFTPGGGRMSDLLSGLPALPRTEPIGDGAVVLRAMARSMTEALVAEIDRIRASAPFRHLITPGGHRMSVAMTNCGPLGWTSSPAGYRYQNTDPDSGRRWPPMPTIFCALSDQAAREAGYPDFQPDACLINLYEPGAKLSLHQDRDEGDLTSPIVSVSLGLPAIFLFGGLRRNDKPRRIRLEDGDVVVWGGPTRLAFHGVETLADGSHPVTGRSRLNLTFRHAG